jgi:hypothetical protein
MLASHLGGAEGELPDEASRAKLIGAELLEARNDSTARRDGDQLDLRAAHPSRRKENGLQRTHKIQVIFYNSLNVLALLLSVLWIRIRDPMPF